MAARVARGMADHVLVSDGALVPDLVGLPLDHVKRRCSEAGLKIDVEGLDLMSTCWGFDQPRRVAEQWHAPGRQPSSRACGVDRFLRAFESLAALCRQTALRERPKTRR